nr:hypothetical protein [uncultured Rhodopila sp.]
MPLICSSGLKGTASAMLGAAALVWLSPAVLAQPATPDTPIAAPAASQRDTYIVRSEAELDDWQAKLLRFCEEAKVQARSDRAATKADLLAALDKAEAGAFRLQTAGAESWDDARMSYERATGDLEVAWDKARADHR